MSFTSSSNFKIEKLFRCTGDVLGSCSYHFSNWIQLTGFLHHVTGGHHLLATYSSVNARVKAVKICEPVKLLTKTMQDIYVSDQTVTSKQSMQC